MSSQLWHPFAMPFFITSEELSRDDWLTITEILTLNDIKVADAPVINGHSILSTPQVYDYIASGNAQGSPVARYLEEAELELKCLAFQDFDFTNPMGSIRVLESSFLQPHRRLSSFRNACSSPLAMAMLFLAGISLGPHAKQEPNDTEGDAASFAGNTGSKLSLSGNP